MSHASHKGYEALIHLGMKVLSRNIHTGDNKPYIVKSPSTNNSMSDFITPVWKVKKYLLLNLEIIERKKKNGSIIKSIERTVTQYKMKKKRLKSECHIICLHVLKHNF
uniref:Uncharacterized protein n=1 Tax=Lactuca sativa TaxID=4236 RepID=A0A9R1W2N4_LACSA|nr:hypothetical protein LSAT_V11C300147340 [Lactuca sativa]